MARATSASDKEGMRVGERMKGVPTTHGVKRVLSATTRQDWEGTGPTFSFSYGKPSSVTDPPPLRGPKAAGGNLKSRIQVILDFVEMPLRMEASLLLPKGERRT